MTLNAPTPRPPAAASASTSSSRARVIGPPSSTSAAPAAPRRRGRAPRPWAGARPRPTSSPRPAPSDARLSRSRQTRRERRDDGIASTGRVAGQRRRQSGAPTGTLLGHQRQTVGTGGDQRRRAHQARARRLVAAARSSRAGRRGKLGTVGRDQVGAGPKAPRKASPSASTMTFAPWAWPRSTSSAYASCGSPRGRLPESTTTLAAHLAHQRVESSHQGQPAGSGQLRAGLVEDRRVALGVRDDSDRTAGARPAVHEPRRHAPCLEIRADLVPSRTTRQHRSRSPGAPCGASTEATLTPLPPARSTTAVHPVAAGAAPARRPRR